MADGRKSIVERMIGAAFLDIATYEEVEADQDATGQAAAVVALVAVCAAIGAAGSGGSGPVGSALAAIVGWLVWGGVTWLVGDKIFGGTATWGELLRTLGFAQTPGILLVLGIVPLVGATASLVASLWVIVAAFIGIRQALDFGNGRTFATIIVGGLIYGALQAIF